MKFETASVAKHPGGIELHHIAAEGTDEEIGYRLGRLAKARHHIDKTAAADASDVESQYRYLESVYPAHYARMAGFAAAYGKTLGRYDCDFSFFGKVPDGTSCSAVHYPPALTRSKHGYISRNLDFPLPGAIAPGKSFFPFEHTYVARMHPEGSYPSLSLLCFEVFGLALEGINSEGLAVVHLADADTRMDHEGLAAKKTKRGFNEFLPIQFLLDTCASAGEAAAKLRQVAHHHVAIPVHLLVADKTGDAFVFEYAPDGAGKVLVRGRPDSPLMVTNFQLNRLSDPAMKEAVASRAAENGFDRYRVLEKQAARTRFPVTEASIRKANEAVYVHGENGERPDRTLFHNIYDTSACSVRICVLPEGKGKPDRFFEFSLEKDPQTVEFA